MSHTGLAATLTLPSGVTLPNRLAKSALSEGQGDRHQAPTPELVRLYERWTRSGAGLLITGNVMIDRSALGERGNVAIEDDRHAEQLARWATAATATGTAALMQLNHPGRQVPRTLSSRPVAPSAVGVTGTAGAFAKPRELTAGEIEQIVQRFATAARVAVAAGFTGVQLHAAHGYLISQFLSPRTNLRTDHWGGTAVRRRRFLLEIVRAVRAEVGAGVPLAVKLNSADFQRGGMDEDESLGVVLALADEGIDLLEISGGTYESTVFMGERESTRAREAYFLDYAERVRAATAGRDGAPALMVTGGFRSRAAMEAAVTGGAVDVVGLGRPMVMEPDLPRRLLAGADGAARVQPRSIGIARLDGMGELMWYGVQMRRLGRGLDPDPDRHPLRNLPAYLANSGAFSRRPRRGFAA